jgi:hypothetical protein
VGDWTVACASQGRACAVRAPATSAATTRHTPLLFLFVLLFRPPQLHLSLFLPVLCEVPFQVRSKSPLDLFPFIVTQLLPFPGLLLLHRVAAAEARVYACRAAGWDTQEARVATLLVQRPYLLSMTLSSPRCMLVAVHTRPGCCTFLMLSLRVERTVAAHRHHPSLPF